MSEPSIDNWLAEAAQAPEAELCGMYLTHRGVVRATAKAEARNGETGLAHVQAVDFSYDAAGLEQAIAEANHYEGVHYVRVWLNEGMVEVGGTLMYVLIGADIRPNCIAALEKLVDKIKNELVIEREIFEE